MLRISKTLHPPGSQILAFAGPNEEVYSFYANNVQIVDFGIFELGATVHTILNGHFAGGDNNSIWRIRVGDSPDVVDGELVLEGVVDSSAFSYPTYAPFSLTGSFVNTYDSPKWVQCTHQVTAAQVLAYTNMIFYTL